MPLTSHCQVALKMMLSVYTPTELNSACLPVSSPILGMIWSVCFVTLMGIIWYLTVTKICISLMTTEIEYHIIYWHLFRFLPSELLVPSCYGILPRFLTDLEEFVMIFWLFEGCRYLLQELGFTFLLCCVVYFLL